jgi:hypothetical protein
VPLCSACGASALTCCKGDNAQRAGVGHSDYLGYVQGYGQLLTDICYSGTVPGTALAAGARACHRAPPGTTAPSSNDDGDEGKENEDNDEEGGQKDKCD